MAFHEKKTLKSRHSTIRIIAGDWRSRKLPILNVDGLRPSGDRVRETVFNWLIPYTPAESVLDLFAGTGALALEALSRGAKSATFIEKSPAVATQINTNLATLNTAQNVITADALNWLTNATEKYDLVFVDPPFANHLWQDVIDQLASHKNLTDDATIYIEAPKRTPLAFPGHWQILKQKTFGAITATLCSASLKNMESV